MPDQDCVLIREQLSRFPGSKLGFQIYRLTYKDDNEWGRFMEYFKNVTHTNLQKYGDEDLIPHIAWEVHEDSAMEGADSSQVHAHFRKRVENLTMVRRFGDQLEEVKAMSQWGYGNSRNLACLAIDQMCVDRCMQDAESAEVTTWENGFVRLVSIEEEDDSRFVTLSSVFPRVYSLVEGPGWDVLGREGVYNG